MLNRIKIKIVGKNIDYFFKEIIKKNISLYSLVKKEHELIITIDYSDYLKIKDMKTTYKISIISRYGLNRYKYLIKTYFILIICFFIGIIINIFLSHIIFNIKVVHPNRKLVNTVIKDLKLYGLSKYSFKPSYEDKEKIKKRILEKEKDLIEWLEIEEYGTKYIVKVEERKKEKQKNNCPERHLIAKKNAMIIDISASEGEIIKKKNDYVTKGEIIVSGLIHNKETIVSKKCATGTVFGEVWYKVKVTMPKYHIKEKNISGKKYGITLQIFDKKYNYPNNLKEYKNEEYNIIGDNLIPLKLAFNKYQKIKTITKKKSLEEIKKEALIITKNKIEKSLHNNEEILGKKVLKIVENNSKIEVEVFVKTKEDITTYQEITDLNIEILNEMNKKEE